MQTHLTFRNPSLANPDADDSDPEGGKLAIYLANQLPLHGFPVNFAVQEDWGWFVSIKNPSFSLWLACTADPKSDDGLLCYINPQTPTVRRWFRKVATREVIERIAAALELIISAHPDSTSIRWWTEDEVRAF